jgi:hypothetical protein
MTDKVRLFVPVQRVPDSRDVIARGTHDTRAIGRHTAGHLIRTIEVTVRGDRKREPDEVFYMNLANPSSATISDGQGVGTLRNDDR